MRILAASKFWYRRGGLERVLFDEIDWLEKAGHEVAHFSTTHPLNQPSPWSDYFVPYLELGTGADLSAADKLVAAARMFSNPVARSRFSDLLEEFRPDVVHVHGIHRQLSPSILFEAKSRGIPVVQSLHDYHHVCPADTLLRRGTEPCVPPACRQLWYGPAVENRCVRGSLAASTLSACETGFQRIRGAYERTVNLFISPSAFLRDVMYERGWRVPCRLIPNGVRLPEDPQPSSTEARPYVLFTGRLVHDKGVDVYLEAATRAGVRAVVAGDGPLRSELERRFPEADFLGHVGQGEVQGLIAGAACCVVPSRCLENAPMSILEPMAYGRPVIATNTGGVPEIVDDGVTGLLVPRDDITALAEAMTQIIGSPEAAKMGEAGRERVKSCFTLERHMSLLVGAYSEVLAS